MNFLKNFHSSFFYQHSVKNFDNDPFRDHFGYQAVNWDKTVIGGSYALHQFTGDTDWGPNDVDIFFATNSMESFKDRVNSFAENTNSTIKKFNDFTVVGNRDEPNAINSRDEKFHELIKGSVTLDTPGFEKEVQFIYLHDYQDRGPQSILLETTDLPSCVCYTVDLQSGQKIFHIPEKGREALLTRRAPKKEICKSRFEKYAKRGYDFY